MTSPLPDRFGPYEVIGFIGAGGMGEVYRARDTRLPREVAIKVLARAGADATRQRRFLEEAQAASALNHPNIVTVYDVGQQGQTPYIVSELVDGVSLRELLARAPLTTREWLDLGVQMAEGLTAAHQAGIVHRDFKPENVMVTRDGRVKILDFGLALVGMRDGASAAEMDVTVSAASVLVGTVPYMSPEQARGAAVDYRTDQFSLGLTLYEMVTGRRAFSAATVPQTLAAILEDDPEPIVKTNPRVPVPVRWVIERCLTKDPRQRYDATADLARELRLLRDRLPEFTITEATPAARHRWRPVALIGGALLATAVGVAALRGNDLSGTRNYRFTPFATDQGFQRSPAWSPDGRTIAYVAAVDGVLQVFTKNLTSPMRAQVTHARFDCSDPFWSADGTRLYYTSLARQREALWSISAAGGEAELVLENVARAALSPDGKTLALLRDPDDGQTRYMTLWLSSPPGSAPVRYTRPPFGDRRTGDAVLHFSPDGSKLGAWLTGFVADVGNSVGQFWVLPIGDGIPAVAPAPPVEMRGNAATFSWLRDNRRVVTAVPYPQPGVHLWLMDTQAGAPTPLTMTNGIENDPALSPDGTRMAFAVQQADYDLYELTLDGSRVSPVLATSLNEMDPAWSESGSAMAFTTDRTGRDEIWLRSERGDWERPLVTAGDFPADGSYQLLGAPSFSADGRRIAYTHTGLEGNRAWITPVAGGPPVRLTDETAVEDSPSWSPDGQWIAYIRGTRGEWTLAKMRVGARAQPQVLAPAVVPFTPVQWAPDGSSIAYVAPDGLSVTLPEKSVARVISEKTWIVSSGRPTVYVSMAFVRATTSST